MPYKMELRKYMFVKAGFLQQNTNAKFVEYIGKSPSASEWDKSGIVGLVLKQKKIFLIGILVKEDYEQ